MKHQYISTNGTRPREKLIELGPSALTDQELLALILGSGSGANDVFKLAGRALALADELNGSLTVNDLLNVPGIGPAKAAQIVGALEFSRRRIRPEGTRIRHPADILPLVRHMADRKQEHFLCLTLNGAHELIALRTVSIGLVNSTQVHPREVFAEAITDRAAGIVIAHNHPSGELTPSEEDKRVTAVLADAGKLLGIALIDHLIFSTRGYLSFVEHGLL